ncbi:MAG: radical SAM/SPASM domain-containing protein [Ktedonobacteraceae bacterium]
MFENIRYLQLETGTACNYRCLYCPVAYIPRRGGFMPLGFVQRIADQLRQFPNLRHIYLNGYDEPTLNPQLVTIIKMFSHLDVIFTLFTNGTRLTPKVANDIVSTGATVEIDIHLSSVDRQNFERIHQSKLYDNVMRNIQYLQTIAEKGFHNVSICISMQGLDNETDIKLYEQLQLFFANTRLLTFKWKPNDRAGLLEQTPYANRLNHKRLKGCGLNNRTWEWLHINSNGKVILCCQDYNEEHVIGNVASQSLEEIITTSQRLQYHRWTVGEEEAPEDYICRKCIHAIAE